MTQFWSPTYTGHYTPEELLPLARLGVNLRCTGHRHFEAVTGIRDHGCSFPRVAAAVSIAERVAGCGDPA